MTRRMSDSQGARRAARRAQRSEECAKQSTGQRVEEGTEQSEMSLLHIPKRAQSGQDGVNTQESTGCPGGEFLE